MTAHRPRARVFALLFVAGAVVCGLAVVAIEGYTTPVNVGLLLLAAAYVVFLLLQRRTTLDLLDPVVGWSVIFWVYTVIGSSNVGYLFGSAITDTQWLLYIGAFVAFLLGTGIGRLVAAATPDWPSAAHEIPWRTLSLRRNLVFAVGMVAVAWSFLSGGVPILGNVDMLRFTFQSPLGYFWAYALRLVIAAAMASAVLFFGSRASGRDRLLSVLVVLGCVLALVATGSRAYFLPVLAVGLVSAGLLRKRMRIGAAVLATVLLIVVVSGFAAYRSSTQAGGSAALVQQVTTLGVAPGWVFMGSSYLSAQVAPHVLAKAMRVVPVAVPFQHGRIFLGDAMTLLPGKQLLADQWVALNIVGTTPAQMTGGVTHAGQGGGIPPGILGGFYLDFGVAGVLAGMLGVGALLAFAYAWVARRPTLLNVALYGSVFAYSLVCIYGFVSFRLPQVWELMVLAFILWPARGVPLGLDAPETGEGAG